MSHTAVNSDNHKIIPHVLLLFYFIQCLLGSEYENYCFPGWDAM